MTTHKPPRPPRVKDARITDLATVAVIEEYVRTSVPDKHKLATQRALLGQMGKALALKQKCLQCCGYQREEVKACTVITCALHPVRPYADSVEDAEDE